MTDTNNTDGAALLPVTQSDGDLTLALIDSLECSTDAPDAPEWAAKFREELADRGFIIARHATQEDAERSGVDVETVAKIIDPDAWHETLPTDGCGVYWIERRNKARSQAKAIAALQPEKADPSNHDQNKAGGLWYRRWFKAQARVNELESALSTPQRQEYDGEAVSAVDAFEMGFSFGMAMRGQTLEDSRAVGRLLTSDTFKAIAPQIEKAIKEQGFDSFQDADSGMCQAKRIIRAALAHPAQARDEMREALERIADPRNTHFAGDAQVVARDALAALSSDKGEER